MFFKRTLTAVAVDSARDYLRGKLNQLKELDLDGDGQKDVDQITEILVQLAEKVKHSVESTDFPKLATGLEQLISGAGMIGSSVDKVKLGAACDDLGTALKTLGHLLKLGVQELKQEEDKL